MNDSSLDIIAHFLEQLVSAVLDEVGRDSVRSLFVGGSVARGEVAYCEKDGVSDIYSDVDLYVVVDDRVDLENARRRCRQAGERIPLEGRGFRFFRGPDVGVYTFDGLASQPARPGTTGLDSNHMLLYGDANVPAEAAARIGTRIELEEALYLLENRLSELAAFQNERRGAGPDKRGDDGYYAFVLCKTGLDVATAGLVAERAHEPRLAERLAAVTRNAGEVTRGWPPGSVEVVNRCWEMYGKMPRPDWASGVSVEALSDAVVSASLAQWKRLAARNFSGSEDNWSDLVLRRCRTGEYMNNYREFRAMNKRCRFKPRGALSTGIHLSRYSSIASLRLSSLMEYLTRESTIRPETGKLVETLGPFLERLTRVCGFSAGSLAERAHKMFTAVQ